MIISHKHKFIFVKLRKTAGTSLEIALSGICGADDVITPISEEDESLRNDLGFRGPQHFDAPTHFYNHMPASEIKAAVPATMWDKYFKFCFERNPWDKTISHYYHRNRNGKFSDIMDYLQNDNKDAIRGYDMYSIDGKVVLDRVFKYEEMDEALEEISNKLKLSQKLRLPVHHAKSQFRADRRPVHEVLSREDILMIADRFSREIAYMGYKP